MIALVDLKMKIFSDIFRGNDCDGPTVPTFFDKAEKKGYLIVGPKY